MNTEDNKADQIDEIMAELDNGVDTTHVGELATGIIEMKKQIKNLQDAVNSMEKEIRKEMQKLKLTEIHNPAYSVVLKKVQPSLIADIERMRADGIFEKYSKTKAGYTSLIITPKSK